MIDLLERAKDFCKANGIALCLEPQLGAGTDGTVWQSSARTAIKVCERKQSFRDELECYRRFQDNQVTNFRGFAVPELENYCENLMVLEMSIVEPPYLLDFGKVYIDKLPPYHDDITIMNEWLAGCRDLFGSDWPTVQCLLNDLRNLGIYYVDPKPANIRFSQ